MILRLKLFALVVVAFIAAAIGLRWQGAQQAIERAKVRDLEGYQDTRRRMDDANADDLDADAARSWLRDRAKRDRDL